MSHMVRITRRCAALTPHWRKRYLHKHVQVMYAQGRLLYVHTPKVLGCTPPAIIRHFSFRSAPCHDIRRFNGHMRTKSHIGVYPLSTLPMPNTTATQWCPIGIVIHGYRRCKSRAVRPFAAVSPTSSLFIIAIVGGLIILGVLPRCLYHIIGLGGTSLGVWLGRLGLGGLGRGVGRAVGRVETAHREVFSYMHGPFGEPTLLHCPCLTPLGAITVQDNTLVHRRGLPRGELVARPPFRFNVLRRAPTRRALGNLRARGHSAASRHGIETG